MDNSADMFFPNHPLPAGAGSEIPPAPNRPNDRSGSFRRVVVMFIVLSAAAVVASHLPLRSWLRGSGQAHQIIESMGIWVYPAGILASALLIGCGVPRLLMCALGGMLLKFWAGLIVVEAGTLIGYYGVFLFARWGGRAWAMRHWPVLGKWAAVVHQHGTVGVILLRQLPIHGSIINLGLGISHVRHRHFLVGTLIGSLPEAIPATLVGAGLVQGSISTTAGFLTIAMGVLAVVWIGCAYLLRAMRGTREGSALMAEAEVLKGNP